LRHRDSWFNPPVFSLGTLGLGPEDDDVVGKLLRAGDDLTIDRNLSSSE